MTQEEKELLLKDLCARLPYGVIVNYKEGEYDFHKWKIETLDAPAYSESGLLIETNSDGWIGYTEYEGCGMSSGSRPLHLDKNLPYLRSISSMTESEFKEWRKLVDLQRAATKDVFDTAILSFKNVGGVTDWLNEHHFDYRGLIDKGLALEAPDGMYKNR